MKCQLALPLLTLISLMIACNMPGSTLPTESATSPSLVTETAIAPSPTAEPSLPPADLPFTIDCSALDVSRATDCETYINNVRDKVYPILRDVTGVSLSTCYDEIHYIITVDDPAIGAGGFADGNTITFSQTYSVNLPYKYDVHEVLHSTSQCSGALDQHILHGPVMNYVYAKLHILEVGYFASRSNAVELNDFLLEAIKTSSGSQLADQCRGILANQTTIAYFDLGQGAVGPMYRSTINPQPVTAPNKILVSHWGDAAQKVQALLEILERDFKYPIDVPACGY